jgi:hypothetical protein
MIIKIFLFASLLALPFYCFAENTPEAGNISINYNEIIEIFKRVDTKKVHSLKEYTEDSLKTLKRVYLSKSEVTNSDLEKLSQLPNVMLWNLGMARKLTPDCTPALERMKSARAIDLIGLKIFKDAETLRKTFKDNKNLLMLGAGGLEQIQTTEEYKKFLEEHPGISVFTGNYEQIKDQYQAKIEEITTNLVETGLMTEEEASKIYKQKK